jgi:hypothetical protein
MNFHHLPPSPKVLLSPRLTAIMFGLLVTAIFFVVDRLSVYYGLSESQRVVDDLCGGIAIGLLVYRYERNRLKYLHDKLKTIELMNHHVRNALQVIVGTVYARGKDQQLDTIRTSVTRIEWALREVLPGLVAENWDEITPQKKPASVA